MYFIGPREALETMETPESGAAVHDKATREPMCPSDTQIQGRVDAGRRLQPAVQ